jgi:hypothetical protein
MAAELTSVIASEAKQSILSPSRDMDCFASLAMTVPVFSDSVFKQHRAYVECTGAGASAYLCASHDDSIAGTRPTSP